VFNSYAKKKDTRRFNSHFIYKLYTDLEDEAYTKNENMKCTKMSLSSDIFLCEKVVLIQFAHVIVEHLEIWVACLTIVNQSLCKVYLVSFHCSLYRECFSYM